MRVSLPALKAPQLILGFLETGEFPLRKQIGNHFP